MGRLADLIGPRRVYLAGTAVVAAGGLLGYQGWSLGSLVVARVVIGLGTSAAYPAAMSMVRRQAQRLDRATPGGVLGALAVAGQATMAIGPPLGGLLIAAGGWRLTFLVNVPLAVAGAAAALAWLPADDQEAEAGRAWRELDPPGLALFAVALTALLLFLMSLASPRWWLLGVTAALLAALAVRELRARTPFLDVRMLAHNSALTATYVRFGITMLITYGFIYGWTPWLEQSAGMSAVEAGLLMVPSFAAAAVVSALAARRRRVWPLLVAGAATLAVGSAGLLLLSGRSPLWLLLAVSVVFGAQNGLNVVTNQAAMYAQAPADSTGTAAGMLRTFMYLGAMASASLISLSFGHAATDAGLHRLAAILTVAAAVLLAATLAGRNLATAPRVTELPIEREKRRQDQMASNDPFEGLPQAPGFTVTSTSVEDGKPLPAAQMSGMLGIPGGRDASPQLSWSGAPSGTRSYAITVYDPDAPTMSGFWHWAVANIPAAITSLPEGAGDETGSGLPQGAVQLPNDRRDARFVGAVPPPGHGPHRIVITVHALDVEDIGLPADTTPAFLVFTMGARTIARAALIATAETPAVAPAQEPR
jgi:Raf kinase inhibitor-like YbhB/YbcL family protein